MIDETIIGYMEDEEYNDQDICMMIIWWFRNYHNYLLRGVKFMLSSLLVCRYVSLSLSPCLLPLSGSPFLPSLPFLSLSHPTHKITGGTRRGISGGIICSKFIYCAILFTGVWIAYCLPDDRHASYLSTLCPPPVSGTGKCLFLFRPQTVMKHARLMIVLPSQFSRWI